jgi:hypothetical protein
MSRLVLYRALLAVLLALPPLAHAGKVIAHPDVELSGDDIRNVYLGEKQWLGKLKLVPVANAAVQGLFLAQILQTDESKYEARWIRKRFREGLTPPATKGSDAEVISFVRSTPGAVGYISNGATGLPGIKILEEF